MTYHLPVGTFLLEQLHMAPLLQQDATLAQHKDDIGVLHRCQSMRYNYHRPSFTRSLERRLHELLTLRVK